MADPAPPPEVALPGWYPDDGGRLRWWTGAAWTEHTTDGPPFAVALARRPWTWSRRTGVALLASAGLALVVGTLAVMGDSFPVSRTGVSATPTGVVIVNAVCPGEHLLEITLRQSNATGPGTALWQIRGDVPVPAEIVIGSAPAGMATTTALGSLPGASAPLALSVETSELSTSVAMELQLADVPSDGVLSFGRLHATRAAFLAAAFADTPCGDPYSRRAAHRVLLIVLGAAVGAAALGSLLLVLARRHGGPPRPERLRFPPG